MDTIRALYYCQLQRNLRAQPTLEHSGRVHFGEDDTSCTVPRTSSSHESEIRDLYNVDADLSIILTSVTIFTSKLQPRLSCHSFTQDLRS